MASLDEAVQSMALQAMRWAGRALIDLVLPPTCISCGAVTGEEGGVCGPCWSRMSFISRPFCERTGAPFAYDAGLGQIAPEAGDAPPGTDRARAAVLFGDVARDLVHGLKYADRLDLARPMARLMAQAGRDLLADADLLVPVPLHPTRLWRRRFNQAALIAGQLSRTCGVPARTDLLRRTRRTPSQTDLDRAARRANVSGAFTVRPADAPALAERHVVVIDDVLTTGATLDACARALRKAGAARVDALTFARVVEFR